MRHLLFRSLLSLSLFLALAAVPEPPPAPAQITLPDLVALDLTASPVNPRWDEPVTVSWTAENRGERPIEDWAGWVDDLHLSTDRTLDELDEDLGASYTNGPLIAGSRYTGGEVVHLPIVPTGRYYLILEVDRSHDIDEEDESNNVLVSEVITIRGLDTDLVPTDVSVSAERTTPGESLTVTWSVENRGSDPVPATQPDDQEVIWFDYLYLSSDATFGEDDHLLSLKNAPDGTLHGPLGSGGGYTITADVTVPVLPTGDYTLLVVVDWMISVGEADEANNVLVGPRIAITGLDIDLQPTGLTTSTVDARWYQRVTVSWTVDNPGTDAIPPRGGDPGVWHGSDTVWFDDLYLSADATLDTGDTRLDSVSLEGPVGAGDSYTTTVQVTIPTVPAGTYRLLVAVDSGPYIHLPERDESNNVLAGPPMTIASVDVDLVPIALTPGQPIAIPGNEITFEWTVANHGTDTIPDGAMWSDAIYLSTDPTLDDSDTILQSIGGWAIPPFVGLGPLPAGASYEGTLWVTLPEALDDAGYLLVLVDADDELHEGDETNNVLAMPFPVEGMRDGTLRIDGAHDPEDGAS